LTGKAHYDTPLGEFAFPVDIVKGKIDKLNIQTLESTESFLLFLLF